MNYLFRAWDKRLKRWIAKDYTILGEFLLFNGYDQYLKQTNSETKDISYTDRLEDIEISISDGSKDKKGNYIYSGDIIVSDWGYGHKSNISSAFTVVVFEFFLFQKSQGYISDNIQVTGNIYEKNYI